MPNLSSLFTKFLFRETLTTEEKTAIRGDIGVPAPPTTESVLALLDGATLEPGTLTLPDFADSTPPANALGLAGGRLALGDGATVAGTPLTPRRVAGMKVCEMNGTNKTSARFAVVGIPLTAAEVVAGAIIQISGTVKLLFDDVFYTAEDPVVSVTIGFAHAAYKTDVATKWLKYNSLPTGTEIPYLISHEIAGDFQLSTNATPGPNKVTLYYREPKIVSHRWAGAAGNTYAKNSGSVFFVNPSDTSVAVTEEAADVIWLSVEIIMGASGTNGDLDFAVVYELDAAVTLP